MESAFQPPMTIRILLPEDSDEIKHGNALIVRHDGQAVEGDLEVMTPSDFLFEIDVSFEGVVRTWLGSKHDDCRQLSQTAEIRFLRQVQHISSEFSSGCCKDHFYVYRLPFQFIIPHTLISPRSDVQSDFLQLCPSAKLGSSYVGPITRMTYMQPSITYMIRIIRVRTEVVMPSPVRCYDQREVVVMPYVDAAPPLEIEHFPHEYKVYTTTNAKQHIWKRTLGHFFVSAEEPAPLNLLAGAPRTSTLVSILLTFVSKQLYEIKVHPWEWRIVAKYCLRSRTFYSTHELDRVPTAFDTRTDSCLKMREEKALWETRDFGGVSWVRGSLLKDEGSLRNETWTTNLYLHINATKVLLPTFLNTLSSRQYSILIQVAIGGLHHDVVELVVPVQVINYPAEAVLSAAHTEMEPSNQEFEPASSTSLSVDSMILRDGGDLGALEEERTICPPPYDCI